MKIREKMLFLFLGSILNKKYFLLPIFLLIISCKNKYTSKLDNDCKPLIAKVYQEEYVSLFYKLKIENKLSVIFKEKYKHYKNRAENFFYIKDCFEVDIKFTGCMHKNDTTYIGTVPFYKGKELANLGLISDTVIFYKNEVIGAIKDDWVFMSTKETKETEDSINNYRNALFAPYARTHKSKFPKELFEDIE
ncbi:MAG: hypothetical protein IPL35_14690 [Sphingobacteriales bacterium]|nr:hypothetical protein [Sphingobacteriales bacterium]